MGDALGRKKWGPISFGFFVIFHHIEQIS